MDDRYERGLPKLAEIVKVAALTAMGAALPQLKVDTHASPHVGCTRTEVTETIMQMTIYADSPPAPNGLAAERKIPRGTLATRRMQ
jgi:4-carboxymuconolactone decarboxylase